MNSISKKDRFLCGACKGILPCEETFCQDRMKRTAHQSIVLDLHCRIFCPKCGHIAAEDMD